MKISTIKVFALFYVRNLGMNMSFREGGSIDIDQQFNNKNERIYRMCVKVSKILSAQPSLLKVSEYRSS